MLKQALKEGEYNSYYASYIKLANDTALVAGLAENLTELVVRITALPEAKLDFRYAADKWTIKEIILHLIDTERVFTFRAMSFARKDKTHFPGFDQDAYVLPSKANLRSRDSLVKELKAVRMATISLLENMDDEMLSEVGTASGSPMSPRAAAFIIMGHGRHHFNIIDERYL